MLFLNDKDIRKIFVHEEVMDSVEKAYKIYEENTFNMPDRISLDNKGNKLMFMPSFIESSFGTKILTLFPENNKKKLPVIDGLLLINDIETGKVLAIMDGKTITEIRTGAVGGLGIKYTTKEDAQSVGLIGLGVQGLVQLDYACKVRNIKTINLFNRDSKKTEDFIGKLRKMIDKDIRIKIYDDERELVKKSEIIITATTSKDPVVPNDKNILRGKHFIGIGSYQKDMREYPDDLFKLVDKVYVDTEFAKEESGDLYQPLKNKLIEEDKIEKFSKFLEEKPELGETTLYKSVGMSLFDLVVGEAIYRKAREKNIGQRIEI